VRKGHAPWATRAEVGDGEIEPSFDLAIGVLGKADAARLANTLKPRGDVDAVAHEIAVALLDHIAKMNANAEVDASIFRHARVALGHRVLNLDCAAHGVHHAAELDDRPVACALHRPAIVDRDGRVDQVATQRPEPQERPILVCARKPAEADDIGGQDRH
jgi:hypothetical protein